MAGFRVFTPHIPESGSLVLDPAESHHLVRVRRARAGDPVEAITGQGIRARTVLIEADGRAAVLRVEERRAEPVPGWRVTLAQALPKGKVMDGVVQRATELGADVIVPLFSEHSEVELDARRAAQKREKWQQGAIESAKQCGNPWVPEIVPPQPLRAFLDGHHARGLALVAALTPDAGSTGETVSRADDIERITLLVGPEGDFSPPEYASIFQAGFRPVSLGPRVLRVETAGCALLAIVLESLRNRTAR